MNCQVGLSSRRTNSPALIRVTQAVILMNAGTMPLKELSKWTSLSWRFFSDARSNMQSVALLKTDLNDLSLDLPIYQTVTCEGRHRERCPCCRCHPSIPLTAGAASNDSRLNLSSEGNPM
jgi:hypothetical protein